MSQAHSSGRSGIAPDAAPASAAQLAAAGRLIRIGDELSTAALLRSLEDRLLAAIEAHHKANPMADGLPREEARERLFSLASPALFEDVLPRVAAANRMTGRDRLALPGRGVSLTPEEARAQEALSHAHKTARPAAPGVARHPS